MESEGRGSCCGSESGAPGDIEKKPGSPALRLELSFRGERGPGGGGSHRAGVSVRWRFGSVLILHALRRAFSTPRSVAALAFVRMSGLSFGPQLLLPNRILQFVGFGLLPEARRRPSPPPRDGLTLTPPPP